MPMMKWKNDHQSKTNSRNQRKCNKAIEQCQVWTRCVFLLRRNRFCSGALLVADRITHT